MRTRLSGERRSSHTPLERLPSLEDHVTDTARVTDIVSVFAIQYFACQVGSTGMLAVAPAK